MAVYTRIASLTQLPAGSALEVEYEGRLIALFRDEAGTVLAIDGICPHQGGPLARGQVSGGVVTCPWHGWSFDLRSGCSLINRRIVQPVFPVQLDGDDILVVLP